MIGCATPRRIAPLDQQHSTSTTREIQSLSLSSLPAAAFLPPFAPPPLLDPDMASQTRQHSTRPQDHIAAEEEKADAALEEKQSAALVEDTDDSEDAAYFGDLIPFCDPGLHIFLSGFLNIGSTSNSCAPNSLVPRQRVSLLQWCVCLFLKPVCHCFRPSQV